MKLTPHQKVILELVMADSPARLTLRQMQILVLIVDGKSNTEIATTLDISINTVKVHVSRILLKLKAKSRTQATALLLRTLTTARLTTRAAIIPPNAPQPKGSPTGRLTDRQANKTHRQADRLLKRNRIPKKKRYTKGSRNSISNEER